MSNPTELSISAEDEKSWFCDFVPKVMCNQKIQKDEGSGEASTKTSKLHLHQKVPLKCTTKTYPKTASTFSTSSCPSKLPKNSLAPVSARALPCGVTWFPKLGGKQQRHCTHTHIKEIWYFHVAGGIPKVWGFGLLVCSPRCHACWKLEVFFGGCWWGPQWNWLWIPRFCTESRGEESNPRLQKVPTIYRLETFVKPWQRNEKRYKQCKTCGKKLYVKCKA